MTDHPPALLGEVIDADRPAPVVRDDIAAVVADRLGWK